MLMRVTARPAVGLAAIATGFDRVDRWMTSPDATVLACVTKTDDYVLRFQAAAFAQLRVLKLGNSELFFVNASGAQNNVRVRVPLRAGWQLLQFQLIGSKPVRPIDVTSSGDTRPLVMTVGGITVKGRGATPPSAGAHPPTGQRSNVPSSRPTDYRSNPTSRSTRPRICSQSKRFAYASPASRRLRHSSCEERSFAIPSARPSGVY